MKSFYKLFATVLLIILLLFAGTNIILLQLTDRDPLSGRPYRVEINRIALDIRQVGLDNLDFSSYQYVTRVEPWVRSLDSLHSTDFFDTNSDYLIRDIDGQLYRFDYTYDHRVSKGKMLFSVNLSLGLAALLVLSLLLFLRNRLLAPFDRLTELPYELAKGNLTMSVKENKNRFFGRFLWGMDLLRETLEQQKHRALELERERKTLLLSLSHDIKTPLSAIKLNAKALSRGLYSDTQKQAEIAENINAKADEIEGYVSQIISASREDFLSLEVNMGEFYLSELMDRIQEHYSEKLALIKTAFSIASYQNRLLKVDLERGVEVLQNIIENALKYGDGKEISISFSQEEDCQLISVKNSGCNLKEWELPHIFESFYRGSNAENIKGSGLGLYICRQLMHRMNGEVFAEVQDNAMCVTLVFGRA